MDHSYSTPLLADAQNMKWLPALLFPGDLNRAHEAILTKKRHDAGKERRKHEDKRNQNVLKQQLDRYLTSIGNLDLPKN